MNRPRTFYARSSNAKFHLVFVYGEGLYSPRAVCGQPTGRLEIQSGPLTETEHSHQVCWTCRRLAADSEGLRRKAVGQYAEMLFDYPHLGNALEGILRVFDGRRSR